MMPRDDVDSDLYIFRWDKLCRNFISEFLEILYCSCLERCLCC